MSPSLRDDFKKEIKELEDYVALVVANAKSYQKTCTDLIEYLVGANKLPGIIITLNKPYNIILRELKNNIDNRLIIFIDGITQKISGKSMKEQNCLFIGSPEKLSDLFVALDQAVNSIPIKEKFIFLDSLNTLAMFNPESTVARFAHQLIAKMRSWKIKGVIMALIKDSEQGLIDELTPYCDMRLDVVK